MRNYGYNGSMMSPTQKFVLATLVLLGSIWPTQISLQFPFWYHLITFLVSLIVLTLILYVAGLVVIGGERAKISRAFTIVFLGTFVNFVLNLFFILVTLPTGLSWEYVLVFRVLLSFIVWLSLIKNFYKMGWLGAFAVAILALITMVVLELLLKSFLTALPV